MSARRIEQEKHDKYHCTGRESMDAFDRESVKVVVKEGYGCSSKRTSYHDVDSSV